MIVDFTQEARNDLEAIGHWIARDNPGRAVSFVDELIDKAEALTDSAMLYPEIDSRKRPGVRRVNHRGYRIFYVVQADLVSILNIYHGRRAMPDFPA